MAQQEIGEDRKKAVRGRTGARALAALYVIASLGLDQAEGGSNCGATPACRKYFFRNPDYLRFVNRRLTMLSPICAVAPEYSLANPAWRIQLGGSVLADRACRGGPAEDIRLDPPFF